MGFGPLALVGPFCFTSVFYRSFGFLQILFGIFFATLGFPVLLTVF
jgi:hypothetical protein